MKIKIGQIYIIIIGIAVFFCAIFFFYDLKHNTRQYFSFDSFVKWDKYDVTYYDTYTEIRGTISIDNINNNQLAFYSNHQNFEIYSNGYICYKYPVVNNNPISKSSGYAWHFISFPEGKNDITIILMSPYKAYVGRVPDFYLGNALAIASDIFARNLPIFLLCTIIFFLGFSAVIMWISMHKKDIHSNTLLYLGIFAMVLSMWSMNESRMSVLLLKNNLASSFQSFIFLSGLTIPVAQFIKYFYESKLKIWDIYSWIALIQLVTIIVLQLTGIADFRDTLWTTHLLIITLGIIVVSYTVLLIIKKQATKKIIIHLICVLIFLFTLLIDIIIYYVGSWDNNVFGRFGLFIYFAIMGFNSINESTDLIKKGIQSKKFERLAYTDQMTGVRNRTAFEASIKELEKNPDETVFVNLDINCLKRTNDTYGHYYGDVYIRAVSQIISDVFSTVGEIYRTGGDEFEVIITNGVFYNMTKYLEKLDYNIRTIDWEGKQPWMTIAHGYAVFNPKLDKTLLDTYKRADEKMYKNKEHKKSQGVH